MSPAGHAAVSYLAGHAARRWLSLPAVVVGGMLPDVDFLLLPFAWFNQIHRVATHNLFFVLAAAAVAAGMAHRGRRVPVAAGMLFGGTLHLLIDSIMDGNPSNGVGIALFWPISGDFFSPFNLLSPTHDAPTWREPWAMVKAGLSAGLLWEVPCWLAAAALWIHDRRRATAAPRE